MGLIDRFLKDRDANGRSPVDPPRRCAVVAPSDANNLPFVSTAFQCLAEGEMKVEMANEKTVTIPDGFLLAGVQYSGQLRKIYATGTNAAHTQVLIWGPA